MLFASMLTLVIAHLLPFEELSLFPLCVNLVRFSFKVPSPLPCEEWLCDPNRANQSFSRGLTLSQSDLRVPGRRGELRHSAIPAVAPS